MVVDVESAVLVTLTAGTRSESNSCFMSFDIFDSTSAQHSAASDSRSLAQADDDGYWHHASATYVIVDLAPGEYTFTARYRRDGSSCTFRDRSIIVMPF